MRYVVGVDIGGTNVVVGTVAEDGSAVHGVRSAPTLPEEGPQAVLGRIARLVQASMAEAEKMAGVTRERIVGVGIGSPGPLDRERGLVLITPNLGWRDLPLRQMVSEAVGLPATLDNDANCAVYGEWWVARRAGRSTWWGSRSAPGSGAGS